ncbi:MAG: hypothetical protein R8K54_05465 [Mariprofundaceae bacterium]
MALTVRPADGLIHRLLLQKSQTTDKSQEEKSTSIYMKVNISQHTREQADAENSAVDSRQQNQSKFESQLLRLYTHHSFTENNK